MRPNLAVSSPAARQDLISSRKCRGRTAIPAEAVWVRVQAWRTQESMTRIYTFAGWGGVFPWMAWEWLQDRQQCPVCGHPAVSMQQPEEGSFQNHEHMGSCHHIAFHELQIAQRYVEATHMTNEDDSPVPLFFLIVLLVPWSYLLSACWSPYL